MDRSHCCLIGVPTIASIGRLKTLVIRIVDQTFQSQIIKIFIHNIYFFVGDINDNSFCKKHPMILTGILPSKR